MNPIEVFKGVYSAAKLAMTAASAMKNADLDLRLAELTRMLAELQVEFSSMLLENTQLKKQLQEERDANQNPPELDGDVFFFKDDYGPCCTKCWDSERKKILLKERSEQYRMANFYDTLLFCTTCNTGHHGQSKEE